MRVVLPPNSVYARYIVFFHGLPVMLRNRGPPNLKYFIDWIGTFINTFNSPDMNDYTVDRTVGTNQSLMTTM